MLGCRGEVLAGMGTCLPNIVATCDDYIYGKTSPENVFFFLFCFVFKIMQISKYLGPAGIWVRSSDN